MSADPSTQSEVNNDQKEDFVKPEEQSPSNIDSNTEAVNTKQLTTDKNAALPDSNPITAKDDNKTDENKNSNHFHFSDRRFFSDEEMHKFFTPKSLKKYILLPILFILIICLTFSLLLNSSVGKPLKQSYMPLLANSLSFLPFYSIRSIISPLPKQNTTLHLDLENPIDETIVSTKQLTLSGETLPNSPLIIIDNNHIYGLQAEDNGHFTYQIQLEKGYHEIKVTAFDPSGTKKEEVRSIYYTEEKL